MNEKILGNGLFDQLELKCIEVSYSVKEHIELIKYIENVLFNTTSIPKDRIK